MVKIRDRKGDRDYHVGRIDGKGKFESGVEESIAMHSESGDDDDDDDGQMLSKNGVTVIYTGLSTIR